MQFLQSMLGIYEQHFYMHIFFKKILFRNFLFQKVYHQWTTEPPQEVFYKKEVLKNFANCTGKQLCRSLFLLKLQTYRPATLLERDSNTGVFL